MIHHGLAAVLRKNLPESVLYRKNWFGRQGRRIPSPVDRPESGRIREYDLIQPMWGHSRGRL